MPSIEKRRRLINGAANGPAATAKFSAAVLTAGILSVAAMTLPSSAAESNGTELVVSAFFC